MLLVIPAVPGTVCHGPAALPSRSTLCCKTALHTGNRFHSLRCLKGTGTAGKQAIPSCCFEAATKQPGTLRAGSSRSRWVPRPCANSPKATMTAHSDRAGESGVRERGRDSPRPQTNSWAHSMSSKSYKATKADGAVPRPVPLQAMAAISNAEFSSWRNAWR